MTFAPHLVDFVGDWRVSRSIEDRLSALVGQFDVTARFERTAAGLTYCEAGQLRCGAGTPLYAERRYLWRADAGLIVVEYADGRSFHSFDPAQPEARHWCDPDDYRVSYVFSNWPVWRTEWVVKGPRKDYTMKTSYEPV